MRETRFSCPNEGTTGSPPGSGSLARWHVAAVHKARSSSRTTSQRQEVMFRRPSVPAARGGEFQIFPRAMV